MELVPEAFNLFAVINKSSTKYFTEHPPREIHIADGKKSVWRYGRILRKKGCEKLSLYSGLHSFYLVLLFLIMLLNCIPYGTEAYLGLPQILIRSSLWQKLMASSWQFSICFNFHVYFFSTLIFSKSPDILVYLTK